MPAAQLARSAASHVVPVRPRSRLVFLSRLFRGAFTLGILSACCLMDGPCPGIISSSRQHQCADSRCVGGCRVLTGFHAAGKDPCASLPVDFRRAALNHPAAAPRAPAPLAANVFQLHSRPGATKVIYLDFDGQVTTNTPWSNGTIVNTAYDMDNNPSSFSTAEQTNIQEIWQRVAECYSPFDVDVTTQAPAVTADLINTGGSDTKWGIRVLFGKPSPSPAPNSGGVAYVGGFGWNYGTGVDVPCFVLQDGVGTVPKYNADAAIHEVGHTLGLGHDGQFPASSPNHVEYYQGQGSGAVAWAPHLGVGYYVPFVQWSKGEYANPSNTQDDLTIITTQNGFTYRPDDYASTQSAALAIPGAASGPTFSVNVSGVIERNTDSDWFKITAGAGAIALSAVGGPSNTMLDIQLSLYNSSGSLVVAANPLNDVVASLNQTVSAGTYYVKIEGVANGDPLTTGYTKYSSLGQYTITGSYVPTTVVATAAPVLGGASNLSYAAKAPATPICPNITVSDADSTTLPSATVTITNVVSSEDVLSFTNTQTMGNIVGSYNKTSGVMTLTSAGTTATPAQFKAALAAVSYSNTNATPSTTPRTINFQASDGTNFSNVLASTITVGSGFNFVTAAYVASTKTLTVNDDGGSNAITITLRGSTITVEAAGTTRIGSPASNATSVTFPYSGAVTLNCNFTGGNDSVSITGLSCQNATINLGDGNDAVKMTYCSVLRTLTVNGGAGTDSLTLTGTFTAAKVLNSVP